MYKDAIKVLSDLMNHFNEPYAIKVVDEKNITLYWTVYDFHEKEFDNPEDMVMFMEQNFTAKPKTV